MMQRMMPLVMVLGSVGMIFVMGVDKPTSWMFGGIFAMSTVGMMAGGVGRGGSQRAETDENRRDYLRYLAQVRKRIRAVAAAQRAALEWTQPEPSALLGVLGTDRLWERRETDPDFGQIRVCLGRQRLATRLVAPQTGPLDEMEPVCAWALRRLIRAHSVVADLPVAVALCSLRRVCLRVSGPAVTGGDRLEPARSLARAMLAQYVVWHSPAEARLAVITSPATAPLWDWTKWLPHVQHPTLTDDIGALRMVTTEPAEVAEWLAAPGANSTGGAEPPRMIVVVDGVDVRRTGAQWLDRAEVTLLRIADANSAAGERGELSLMVEPDRLGMATEVAGATQPGAAQAVATQLAEPKWIGTPDTLSLAEASTLARRMAKFRPPRGAEPDTGRPLRNTVGLPELLGMEAPGAISVARARWGGSASDRLRVPIGVGASGEPVLLDLKESAQGGFGPHGLCIGATGSGKSELLRTLLLGLAATHPSDELNLVLVDFKGGATFLGMSHLPHVSAVITNLADELTLVDRMADALAGEITRRQEMLRDAGNLAGVGDYERKRRTHPEMAPLPALLIVVDEFSEMLAQRPELVDLMVTIGRLGRSLQMHLLLASQRLDEGRLRGLESHLSYRIALRTFSPAESRAVLGVPDAYQLPPMPGSGYMALGTDELVRFRAAYVSGAQDVTASPGRAAARGAAARPRVFTATKVGPRTGGSGPATEVLGGASIAALSDVTEVLASSPAELRRAATGSQLARAGGGAALLPNPGVPSGGAPGSGPAMLSGGARGAEPPEGEGVPSVMDLMVAAMVGNGPPAHRVWLPPLETPPALNTLLPTLGRGPRGLGTATSGGLRVAIGQIDRPYYQRWDPLVVDMSGAAGHAVVVGAPQSGKSTALRTLVLGLALTNTPRELTVYGLDFGGGMLNALAGLPHAAGVADRQQPDVVRRIVAEVTALLADRERSFRAAGIDSAREFRRRRASGEFAEDPHGDVFLVIDGYLTMRTDFEDLEAQLLALAMRGLSYGVHLLITASRWIELRPALKDLLGTRLELRLGDPGDSEINRHNAARVPARPGSGLAPDGGQMVIARPEVDAVGDGLAPAVAAMAQAWSGPRVPAVRLLPERMPYRELMARIEAAAAPSVPHLLPVGVDEARLEPVYLDFATDPHLLCFADGESGKTNLLRVIARGITDRMTPEQARIVLVDYRRTLLGQIPSSHLIAYSSNADAVASTVTEVAGSLRRRMPGPDVTPKQLRERTWWQGPEVYLLVDDYDLVTTPGGGMNSNPLLPLLEFLPQAKDVGLHLVVVRRSGGASRALFEPIIARLRELASPGLVMSGSPDEGPLLEGIKATPQPPGRGTLLSRRGGARRVQLALLDPDLDAEPVSAPESTAPPKADAAAKSKSSPKSAAPPKSSARSKAAVSPKSAAPAKPDAAPGPDQPQ
jgi:S-DNA-T family DNA segregation ATPase FtsK/SpoIIIE